MQIGQGVQIGTGTTLATTPALSGPVFSYNVGNSMSFSGSGVNETTFNTFAGNIQGAIFDLSADYANNSIGNTGYAASFSSQNLPTWVNQGPASYFEFNGNVSGDAQAIYCNAQNSYNIPSGSSFTYFCTVRFNNLSDSNNEAVGGGQLSGFGLFDGVGPGNGIGLIGFIQSPFVDIDTTFVANTWYALAFTYDSTSQTGKLYVNGTLTATQTSLLPFSGNDSTVWGVWFPGQSWLNGDLGIMQVWTRALSEPEIQNLVATEAAPYLNQPVPIYSALYTVPGSYLFTVPDGVSNVSIVTVGGGGGHDVGGNVSTAGAPSFVGDTANYISVSSITGANTTIYVDGSTYPQVTSLDQTYAVFSTEIGNIYGDPNFFGMVTSVDTGNINNVAITTSVTVSANVDVTYNFVPALVESDGAPGYPGNATFYNNGNHGPGYRATGRVGFSGEGGVVSYIDDSSGGYSGGGYYQTGGAGAGGYATDSNYVAFDPNWTYLYNYNSASSNFDSPIALSNNNLTATCTANALYAPPIASGTYPIGPNEKVMFSVTQSGYTSVDSNNSGIGLRTPLTNLQLLLSADSNSGVIWNDGSYSFGSSSGSAGYFPAFQGVNPVIDLAVDTVNLKLWFRVNGGPWFGNGGIGDPVTNTNGFDFSTMAVTYPLYVAFNMGFSGEGTDSVSYTFNTTPVTGYPYGFTFIAGHNNADSTGGDGSDINFINPVSTAKPGQGLGGSAGGGGTGQAQGPGAGGGGTGIYGAGAAGAAGLSNLNQGNNDVQATGGGGGSPNNFTGSNGGQATNWNGGYGGFPGGGGGGSFYGTVGGNGGALSYVNNVDVAPGQTLGVIVGKGGYSTTGGGQGGGGAVRILFNGTGIPNRQFPSTNTGPDNSIGLSFTITASDFNYWNDPSTDDVPGVLRVPGTASGYSIGDVYSVLAIPQGSIATDLTTFFNNYGLSPDGTAYIFHVTWADGSSVKNGLVRLSWNGGSILVSAVDTNYTAWQTSNPTYADPTNPAMTGVFKFPAIFTPYFPTIFSNGHYWC